MLSGRRKNPIFFGCHKIFYLKAFLDKGFLLVVPTWVIFEKAKYVGSGLPLHQPGKVI